MASSTQIILGSVSNDAGSDPSSTPSQKTLNPACHRLYVSLTLLIFRERDEEEEMRMSSEKEIE